MVCICGAPAARLLIPPRPSRPRAILHTGLAALRQEDANYYLSPARRNGFSNTNTRFAASDIIVECDADAPLSHRKPEGKNVNVGS
ncbi:hypothetical protein JZ751_021332 [Albula glossodonta]|uniref:Uncharacterized protein n=1 Tax=Albula glossodonta TaxID=121402 RepID=A0A8T2NSB0_9TELE|nr:hypothetical protein JZ751_021332 [Albula glossodonta]